MNKISKYILKLSSKRLAIYLILFPLFIILTHTSLTIIYRKLYDSSEHTSDLIPTLLIAILSLLALVFLLWFFWLRATTLSIDDDKLGLPKKWFHIVFGLFLFYVFFNLSYDVLVNFMQNTAEEFTWILYASIETISFVGLLILYPTLCHYSARALYVVKHNKNATFLNSIGYTLLLTFIPISIPFLHNYFSPTKTETNTLIKIYGIGLAIMFLIFIIALVASITGIF